MTYVGSVASAFIKRPEDLEKEQAEAQQAQGANLNGQMPTANIMGNYKTYLKQGEFKEYLMALESSGLLKELTSSFDCEQDLVLQKKIADIFFKHKGSAKINDAMKKELAKYGIEVEFSHAKTQYITDEKATGGKRGNAHTGTITVMTFRDKNGGEIKIADANGNSFLESEELFLNEILGGVNIDIGNAANFELSADESQKAQTKFEMNFFDGSDELVFQDLKDPYKNLDEEELSETELQAIKDQRVEAAVEEIMDENPEMSEADAKSLATSQVDAEIARIYNKNDAGKYVRSYDVI